MKAATSFVIFLSITSLNNTSMAMDNPDNNQQPYIGTVYFYSSVETTKEYLRKFTEVERELTNLVIQRKNNADYSVNEEKFQALYQIVRTHYETRVVEGYAEANIRLGTWIVFVEGTQFPTPDAIQNLVHKLYLNGSSMRMTHFPEAMKFYSLAASLGHEAAWGELILHANAYKNPHAIIELWEFYQTREPYNRALVNFQQAMSENPQVIQPHPGAFFKMPAPMVPVLQEGIYTLKEQADSHLRLVKESEEGDEALTPKPKTNPLKSRPIDLFSLEEKPQQKLETKTVKEEAFSTDSDLSDSSSNFAEGTGHANKDQKLKEGEQETSFTIKPPQLGQPPVTDASLKSAANGKVKGNRPLNKYTARDFLEIWECPFLALSNDRRNPIEYEKRGESKIIKINVCKHPDHFLVSRYDWDVILFIAKKLKENFDVGKDSSPRTLIVNIQEIFQAIPRLEGQNRKKLLEKMLSRLQFTTITKTIIKKNRSISAEFRFLDSWGYTDRKDTKEVKITVSKWLYDGIRAKGALFDVDIGYFNLVSGLKLFLYQTAREHVGQNQDSREVFIEEIYEKSGSEVAFSLFRRKLIDVVSENDIPGYTMKWIQRSKEFIYFIRSNTSQKSKATKP